MTIISNTYTTYGIKGIREDLANTIYNISPTETPFVSNVGRGKATNTLFEWQTDTLAAAISTNAQLEGDDAPAFPTVAASVRVGNYAQIARRLYIVAGTVEAMDKAGRNSEVAYQKAKRGAELKRDIETTLLDNIGGVAGSATTARVTATMGAWVKTSTDKGGSGGDPVYTSGVPAAARTDGTLRTFTEAILQSVARKCFVAGANPSMLMVGPVNKARASGFAGVATKTIQQTAAKSATIIGSADVYVGEFDTFSIVPNRFQREVDGWLLDADYLSVVYVRPIFDKPLSITGDQAAKGMIMAEFGLRVNNEAALGLCADLTTA